MIRKFNSLVEQVLLEFDFKKTVEMLGWNDEKLKNIGNRDSNDSSSVRPYDQSFPGPETSNSRLWKWSTVEADLKTFDPTPNQAYSRWIITTYLKNGINRWEDLGRVRTALELFHQFKARRLTGAMSDIFKFKKLSDLEDFVEDLEVTNGVVSSNEDEKKISAEAHKNAKVTKFDGVTMIQPLTMAASCYFGRGTRWCTAAKTNNMHDNYASRGNLYIFTGPKLGNNKFQLWKADRLQDSYMCDEKDIQVEIGDTISKFPVLLEPIYSIFGLKDKIDSKFTRNMVKVLGVVNAKRVINSFANIGPDNTPGPLNWLDTEYPNISSDKFVDWFSEHKNLILYSSYVFADFERVPYKHYQNFEKMVGKPLLDDKVGVDGTFAGWANQNLEDISFKIRKGDCVIYHSILNAVYIFRDGEALGTNGPLSIARCEVLGLLLGLPIKTVELLTDSASWRTYSVFKFFADEVPPKDHIGFIDYMAEHGLYGDDLKKVITLKVAYHNGYLIKDKYPSIGLERKN